MPKVAVASHDSNIDDFDVLIEAAKAHFKKINFEHAGRLFVVETDGLYEAYLANLSADEVASHTCHNCRRFMEQYGNLVAIDVDGQLISAVWDEASAPEMYKASIKAMARLVTSAKVKGVFHTSEKVWGLPMTGTWSHFSLVPEKHMIHKALDKSAYEAYALSIQNFGTLSHGLSEFSRDVVAQAVSLIEADTLNRSEKVEAPAKFLLDLHNAVEGKKGERKRNVIWKAVGAAPVGFCSPRSSIIGTLLEDIQSGMNIENVKRRFADKMDPLQYRRPQAAPAAGNIVAAEKLVEKLGIQRSFERRFARLDEVVTIWKPAPTRTEKAGKEGGMFGHIEVKGAKKAAAVKPLVAPLQNITFEKFRRKVLPSAIRIEVFTTSKMNLRATVTAVHDDAPPILQWDHEEQRNPFSCYVYRNGSTPEHWNLPRNEFVDVTGITLNPAHWYDEDAHANMGKGALFILENCKDTQNSTLALFPEIMRSELHSISSTVEAFSQKGKLEGLEEASANGLSIGNDDFGNRIRVTTENGIAEYRIDRWD